MKIEKPALKNTQTAPRRLLICILNELADCHGSHWESVAHLGISEWNQQAVIHSRGDTWIQTDLAISQIGDFNQRLLVKLMTMSTLHTRWEMSEVIMWSSRGFALMRKHGGSASVETNKFERVQIVYIFWDLRDKCGPERTCPQWHMLQLKGSSLVYRFFPKKRKKNRRKKGSGLCGLI